MHITLSDLFAFDQQVSPSDQEILINQLIEDSHQEQLGYLPEYHMESYQFDPYGSVIIVLKKPIFFIDPLSNHPLAKMITDQLYNEYLQQEETNFRHSEEEIDQARIWPKFHTLNNQYYVFSRFGYIRDRIGHTPEKEGYRLEFMHTPIGEGGYATIFSAATAAPEKDAVQYAERATKSTRLSQHAEDRLVESKVLNMLPYDEYKKKKSILYFDTISNKPKLLIPQKHLPGNVLKNFIKAQTLSVNSKIDITISFLQGVQRLHQLEILHRDIKPENIMVVYDQNQQFTARLIDFGLSVIHPQLGTTVAHVGTTYFWSPEVKAEPPYYSTHSDSYAAIITLLELLYILPCQGDDSLHKGKITQQEHEACINAIKTNMQNSITYLSEEAKAVFIALVEAGLAYNPVTRPPITDIINSFEFIKQTLQPAYTFNLANHVRQQILASSSASENLTLLLEALRKVPPDQFANFKWALNINHLMPFTSTDEATQFLNKLQRDVLQTHVNITTTQGLLYEYLEKLNTNLTSASKTQLIDALNNQIQQFNHIQHHPSTNFDEWCAWHTQLNQRYGEGSIIHQTLNWLLDYLVLNKIESMHPFTFASLQPKEPLYDCIKVLCGQHQDDNKLYAIMNLIQNLTANNITSLCGKLNIPPSVNLMDMLMQKTNELHGITPDGPQ